MQSTTTRDNAQTVKVFSPRDNVPAALADMTNDAVWQHIQHARRLIEHHEDIARNGDEGAAVYYFFIPEVAQDLANARYTLAVCFAEIGRRKADETNTTPPAPVTANNEPMTVMVTPSWKWIFYPHLDAAQARELYPDRYMVPSIETCTLELRGNKVQGAYVQIAR